MILMVGDHNSSTVHYWAGKYPNAIGRLIGPQAFQEHRIKPWLPWALDNDAYAAYASGKKWDQAAWLSMLNRAAALKHKPRWVLVPDVVGNRNKTLENWYHYSPQVSEYGFALAFAAQDGMTPCDVPAEAEVVFVGGTTEWKWRNASWFCREFKRVHVGRVGTIDRLWLCRDYGAESVDGTGWFRDGTGDWRFQKLESFFKGEREPELFTYPQLT